MTIKYAARGISTQMRTAEELLFTDGVTLKPATGGDVFVADAYNECILVGTNYNAVTGGCTVNGTVYENEDDLGYNDYYVISSAFSPYDLTTGELVGIGHDGTDYLRPDYIWSNTLSYLAEAGYYLTDTPPTSTPVWKISDGTTGTRYTGSEGDAVVRDAGGLFSYYATVSACDAVWTTEEPSTVAWLNTSHTNVTMIGNLKFWLYDSSGNTIPYDSTKIYTITGAYRADGTSVISTQYVFSLVSDDDGYGMQILKAKCSSSVSQVCYFEYSVS